MAILEDLYSRSKFLSTAKRLELGEELKIDAKHLRLWWRNRRQRESRSGMQTEKNLPMKKRKVSRSTSAAPTPSPAPSNLSPACSVDQWQPLINQPIDSPLYNNEESSFQDPYSMPYQIPVQYMSHNNHYPYIDPAMFPIDQQMAQYQYAHPHYNDMELAYHMANENLALSQYYYGQGGIMNDHFSYLNDASAHLAQLNHQIKLEPMDPMDLMLSNQFEVVNMACTTMDGLLNYWQQMKNEFPDHVLLDQ